MKITLTKENFGKFKDIINTIANTIDEGTFTVNTEGFEFKSTDRGAVSYTELKIRKEFFREFVLDGNTLSLNIITFKNLLNRLTEQTTLETQDNDLTITSNSPATGNREFTLRMLDLPEKELPNIQELQFSNEFLLNTNLLKTSLSDCKLFSDAIEFMTLSNSLTLKSEGSLSKFNMQLMEGVNFKPIKMTKDIRTLYPIDYLEKFISNPLADVIKIRLDDSFPIEITQTAENIHLRTIISPRVLEK